MRKTFLWPLVATALLSAGLASAQAPSAGGAGLPAAGAPDPRGPREQPRPTKKQVLVWCDTRGGGAYHESVNRIMAVIQQMGVDTGLFDAYLRTDSQLVTKKPIVVNANGTDWRNNKNLNYFDAIFFCGLREVPLTDDQKADLISFVKEDGKGFIAVHAADTALLSYPQFGEMMGATYDGHPWGQVDATVIVEDPANAAMKGFPTTFQFRDEMYQVSNFARENTRVLARVDPASVDLKHAGVHRTDGDFPQVWIRQYGKGRVFVSAFGHASEVWDRPDIKNLCLEAIKWATGLTQMEVTPRPLAPGAAGK